jgi:Ca2+-binding RTX toxin-like protein
MSTGIRADFEFLPSEVPTEDDDLILFDLGQDVGLSTLFALTMALSDQVPLDREGPWTLDVAAAAHAAGIAHLIAGTVTADMRHDAFGFVPYGPVGSDGPDHLTGSSVDEYLSGAGGDDVINGAGGPDTLDGGAGDDTLFGGEEGDTLIGGTGNDTAYGDAGDDTLLPDAGTDTLGGGAGQDWIDASEAGSAVHTIDLMLGKLVGLGAQDVVLGVEHIRGSSYGEGVIGDDLANTLLAGGGNDHVWGNAGADEGHGQEGSDDLHGGAGGDVLFGGDGNDLVDGQWGNDTLTGGSGADRFAFWSGDGSDRITDFLPSTDRLELIGFGYSSAAQVLALATASGTDTVLVLDDATIRLLGLAPTQLTAADILLSEG